MEQALSQALRGLPIPAWRFFERIGSTNDEALRWAAEGAADLSLVIADEQTAGRGRSGRRWYTPPGAALAVSVVLRPRPAERIWPARLTALGALALYQTLRALIPSPPLAPALKWPNDILLNGKKVAGVLVEALWEGEEPLAFVLGMGVNVSRQALPPAEATLFPATTLEHELGKPPERPMLLRQWLEQLLSLRSIVSEAIFLQLWDEALAWRGEMVKVILSEGEAEIRGRLLGLEVDGQLRLETLQGEILRIPFGDVRLRTSL